MKRKVAKWIGGGLLISISILIYLFLFRTNLFSSFLINVTNSIYLQSRGLVVSGNIEGGLLGKSLAIKDLEINMNHSSDTLLTAHEVKLVGWGWNWSTSELTVEHLSLSGYSLRSQNVAEITEDGYASDLSFSTIIQNIDSKNGQLIMGRGDSTLKFTSPSFQLSLSYIDGFMDTKIHSALVTAPSFISDTLDISGLFSRAPDGQLSLQNLNAHSGTQSIRINFSNANEKLSMSLVGQTVDPSHLSFVDLPSTFSDILVTFDINMTKGLDDLSLSGDGHIEMNQEQIPFKIQRMERNSEGENIDLTLGKDLETMHIVASRSTAGGDRAEINLFRFNLTPLLNQESLRVTEPIGEIFVRGREGNYKIATYLKSFRLNGFKFDTLRSNLTYSDPTGLVLSSGLVTQSKNRMQIAGKLSLETLDLDGDISFSDFSFLDATPARNAISGVVTSQFNISGNIDEPRLTGDLHPNNLSYANRLTLTGEGKVDFLLKDGHPLANVALMGNSGFLFGDSLKSYTILGNISEDGYFIEDLHLQGLNNLASISGGFVDHAIHLNKLNLIKGVNQLKLADTVRIESKSDGSFHIPSSVITFNNGGLSVAGNYSAQEGLHLKSNFELIDIARILEFFRLKVDFSGMAAGTARISGDLTDPIIDAKIALKDGVTLGYPSDSANVDLRLSSSSAISKNIDAYSNGGYLNLVGTLPWGYKVKKSAIENTSQNFSIHVNNYLVKDLKFTSISNLPISGRVSGYASIRGTPANTKLDGQLNLENATFDLLTFSKVYSELSYEGNLLTFDTLSMVSNWGYGSGNGFMPISLDLIAADRMFVSDRDIGLDFDFNLNEIPFLSSYISSIDAIQGDFTGQLNLSGPFSGPMRSGKIRGHNGRLDLAILGNPVTNIHAEASLVDNTLTIDHFTGRMDFSEGSNLNTQGAVGWLASKAGNLIGVNATQNYAGDVSAAGTINLTSFFEPRFNINLKANEVYYRSTDGLIEAIADATLKFTGQDTLNVEGVIPVLRAGYYANFESETSYDDQVSDTDSSIFKYSLNTEFASDLLISNDQMEAEFEGELWLLDYGDGIMRFTGTLSVLDGGKFYYLGNELTLRSGEIVFNSVDFNPQIKMEAEIDIEGDQVTLALSGDLNEPELVINAENTQLTQSDVLTYLTLNKTLVEVSFDQSALDPVKNYSEILVEKQISKLGREYIGLDLVGVDLASDSTANARFHLGQRLSKNLMVTYEGAIQPANGESDYDFGFEYQINKNVSITTKINQNQEVELNGRLKFTY